MRRNLSVFGILALFATTTALFAGRPFSTEDAGVAGRGVIQLEEGFDYADIDRARQITLTLVPIVGINDTFELSVEFPFTHLRDPDNGNAGGRGDTKIVMKTLLFPESDAIPNLLFRTSVKFADGDEADGLGSGDEDFEFTLAATRKFSGFILHANLGHVFAGDRIDDAIHDYMIYGIAVEMPIVPRISVVTELYGESDTHHLDEIQPHTTLASLVGVVWKPSDSVMFDLAARIGLEDESEPSPGFTAGVSLTF